jgi:hypothetical protein
VSFTCHAEARIQQRAIPPIVVELLERFGSETRSGGADLLFLDKAARKLLRRHLGRSFRSFEYLDAYAVVSDQGRVVTVGHRSKRINRP